MNQLDPMGLLMVLAIVVQVVTELAQRFGLRRCTLVVAVGAGCLVAFSTRLGLLGLWGIEVTPLWLDSIYLGLTLAGGGWAVDLVKRLGQGVTRAAVPPPR